MILLNVALNIAFFLMVSAIIIAYAKPKSITVIWLYSLVTPIMLVFWVALLNVLFLDANSPVGNRIAFAFGECLISIIISTPTIFYYLKKKLLTSEQSNFPKGLIYGIIILTILGVLSECGNYRWKKSVTQTELSVESQYHNYIV